MIFKQTFDGFASYFMIYTKIVCFLLFVKDEDLFEEESRCVNKWFWILLRVFF